MYRATSLLVSGVVLAGLSAGFLLADEASSEKTGKPSKAAIERTRKTVRMLDDVYKTAVVLITDKYVHDENDFPAGSAAIALFGEVEKKGWHGVRLIDVSGQPYDPENVAKDDFEKDAVRQLRDGKDYVEKVVEKDGKPALRAMTPIPVVMQKCVMCHPHYADAKKRAAVGAISYTLTIE